jgi:hypothetical protein
MRSLGTSPFGPALKPEAPRLQRSLCHVLHRRVGYRNMSNPGTDHANTNVLVEVSVNVDGPLGVDFAMDDVAPPTRETS